MAVVRPEDVFTITVMRRKGVLQDVMPGFLDQGNGAVIVTCSDCDEYPSMIEYQARLQIAAGRASARIHTIAVNGGPLRIPAHSPFNRPGSIIGDDLVADICDALQMKEMRTVLLLPHWRCGKAAAARLAPPEAFKLLLAAKRRVKEAAPRARVAPLFFMRYSEQRPRTYFVSRRHHEQAVCGIV